LRTAGDGSTPQGSELEGGGAVHACTVHRPDGGKYSMVRAYTYYFQMLRGKSERVIQKAIESGVRKAGAFAKKKLECNMTEWPS